LDDSAGVVIGKTVPTFGKNDIVYDQVYDIFRKESLFQKSSSYVPAKMGPVAFDIQMEKWRGGTIAMPDLSLTIKMVIDVLRRFITPCVFLKKNQVIPGIKDAQGVLEPVDRNKSAGILLNVNGNKGQCIDSGKWQEWADLDWKSCKKGVPLGWLFRLSQKVEKRDNIRVLNNKTRVFCAAPCPLVATGRRCCGDFVRKFYHSHLSNFSSTVGINIWGGNWHRMLQDLTDDFKPEYTEKMYEGDISGMDKSYPAELLLAVRDVIASFYNVKDRYKIYAHWDRYIHKLVVDIYGSVRLIAIGNASGTSETVVINTIGTIIMATYQFLSFYPDALVNDLLNHLREKFYGDDVIGCGLSRSYETWVCLAREFNFTVTGSDTTLDKICFLGRYTVKVGDFYLPSLSHDRVLGILMWTKKMEDPVARYSRASSALLSAFPLLFTQHADVFLFVYSYCKYLYDKGRNLDYVYRNQITTPLSPYELGAFYCGMSGALDSVIYEKLVELNSL
jgi:hypothetical protein